MLKQLIIIGLFGLSSVTLWATEVKAWIINGIFYGPRGSYICEVEIEYENFYEKQLIKKGKVFVTCDQQVDKRDLRGICQNPRGHNSHGDFGRGRPSTSKSKPFDFQSTIETRVNFYKHCDRGNDWSNDRGNDLSNDRDNDWGNDRGTCTVRMVQVSTLDDVRHLIHRGKPLPDACHPWDSAQDCIEKVFGVTSEAVCKKKSTFFGAVIEEVEIEATIIAAGVEEESETTECESPEGAIINQNHDFDCEPIKSEEEHHYKPRRSKDKKY